MKTFAYQENYSILHGKQIYRKSEYSFDFLPQSQDELKQFAGTMGTASLSIGTLQIEIGIENRNLLYVWGYHPYFSWKPTSLPKIEALSGSVILSSDHKLKSGISLAIDESQEWQTLYDTDSKCLVITRYENFLTGTHIRIAEGCVVGLKEKGLASLLLHVEQENETVRF